MTEVSDAQTVKSLHYQIICPNQKVLSEKRWCELIGNSSIIMAEQLAVYHFMRTRNKLTVEGTKSQWDSVDAVLKLNHKTYTE